MILKRIQTAFGGSVLFLCLAHIIFHFAGRPATEETDLIIVFAGWLIAFALLFKVKFE